MNDPTGTPQAVTQTPEELFSQWRDTATEEAGLLEAFCAGLEHRQTELAAATQEAEGAKSSAGAFKAIWAKWKDHAELKSVLNELTAEQHFGCGTIFNEWVNRLLANRDDLRRQLTEAQAEYTRMHKSLSGEVHRLRAALASEKADHLDSQRKWDEAINLGLRTVGERDRLRGVADILDAYVVDLREKAAQIANDSPDEKQRFVGRAMILLCEKYFIDRNIAMKAPIKPRTLRAQLTEAQSQLKAAKDKSAWANMKYEAAMRRNISDGIASQAREKALRDVLIKCFKYLGTRIELMTLNESANYGTQGLSKEIAVVLDANPAPAEAKPECPARSTGGDHVTRPWSNGKCAYCGENHHDI